MRKKNLKPGLVKCLPKSMYMRPCVQSTALRRERERGKKGRRKEGRMKGREGEREQRGLALSISHHGTISKFLTSQSGC
jgi:hypothetical protein